MGNLATIVLGVLGAIPRSGDICWWFFWDTLVMFLPPQGWMLDVNEAWKLCFCIKSWDKTHKASRFFAAKDLHVHRMPSSFFFFGVANPPQASFQRQQANNNEQSARQGWVDFWKGMGRFLLHSVWFLRYTFFFFRVPFWDKLKVRSF